MQGYMKIIVGVGLAILFIFGSWYGYGRLTADDIELKLRDDEPFGVRIALLDDEKDDSLEMLLQMTVFPGHKRVCFYFVNTEAFFEDEKKPLREMSASSADRFESYTGIASDYTMTLKKKDAVRLLNLVEGVSHFVDQPVFLENARFQYPRGVRRFSGEQVLEYVLGREKTDRKKKELLASIDRLFRQESVVLNLFWRLALYKKQVTSAPLKAFMADLIDTGMTDMELNSLAAFLSSGVHAGVLEVPLEAKNVGKRDQLLQVKDKRARGLFQNYRDGLKSTNKPVYTMEVLNGTETPRLARRVKQFMRDKGPTVLSTGNYEYKPLPTTVIVDRAGNTFHAHLLARKTRTKRARVFFRRRAMLVNSTFILGNDFKLKNLRL